MSTVKFQGITPYLHYEDAAASLDWLARVFGFEEVSRYVDGDGRCERPRCSSATPALALGCDPGTGRRRDGPRAAHPDLGGRRRRALRV